MGRGLKGKHIGEWPGETPEEQLALAILWRAVKDVESRDDRRRDDALAFLRGPGAELLCEWLNLDPDEILCRVTEEMQKCDASKG